MKKYALGLFAISFATTSFADRQEVFGRSFMYTRPAHFHLSTQQALWHNVIYNKKAPQFGAMQLIGFYQQSSSLEKTSRYFLINGKNELVVSGDANTNPRNPRDIRAEWLGLPSNFTGSFTLKPEQKQIGGIIEYNQDLKKWFSDTPFLNAWQISISAPIIAVENDLNLRQKIRQKGTPIPDGPEDIVQAFQQPSWCFSRIEGKKNKIGLAELRFNLGSTFVDQDYFQIAYYSTLVVPTAQKQDPKNIFSPVVGNNRHVGIGGGVHFQFPLNRDTTEQAFNFYFGLEGLFLIRNKQKRTFDLRNKPFSRFLFFNKEGGPPNQNIPGVNVLTFESLIRPYGMFDFVCGWRYTTKNLELEFGYNVWGHDSETVELRPSLPFASRFGIAGDGAANQDAPPEEQVATSANNSTIEQRAANDATFVTINENDIDLCSGSAESALNHKIHFSVGAIHIGQTANNFIGLGTFVDLPQKNSALRMWGVWAKAGIAF